MGSGEPMTIKVGINGYGTIGKRVAHAVSQQDDMKIVGVCKRHPTFETRDAIKHGYAFYAASEEFLPEFKTAGIKTNGVLTDLLNSVDLIVDCTPKKAGYRPLYEKHKVRAIWQGGEKHEVAGLSFNSTANYEKALGARFARVVSCNTTGLCRTLSPIDKSLGIESALAVMIRRATDPGDSKKGPINAIEPEVKVPSHHGPDVKTCMPDLNLQTMAVKVPTTIMHLHQIVVKLKKPATSQEIIKVWENAPRVLFVDTASGINSTAQVMELARDLGRDRGDLYEIAIWKDGINVVGNTLYYTQAIHQESDVIPENVDCIRAMCGLEKDAKKSIAKTNKAMGINK
jgi:glyceraldehyde-3-phosphate dehydrogenase (NAD(P))